MVVFKGLSQDALFMNKKIRASKAESFN